MSIPLVVAALLTFGIGLAHSILGERYIISRLFRRTEIPKLFGSDWFTKRTIRFAWHLTTVAWFGLAVIMLILADRIGSGPDGASDLARDVGVVIAVVFAASSVIAAGASRLKHFAWPLFGAVAVLIWVAI